MRFARYSPLSFSLIISKGDEPFLTGGLLPRSATITVTVVNQWVTERSAGVTKPSDRQALTPNRQALRSDRQALAPDLQALALNRRALAPDGRALTSNRRALVSDGQALRADRGALTLGIRALGKDGQACDAGGEALTRRHRVSTERGSDRIRKPRSTSKVPPDPVATAPGTDTQKRDNPTSQKAIDHGCVANARRGSLPCLKLTTATKEN